VAGSEVGPVAAEHLGPLAASVVDRVGDEVGGVVVPPSGHGDVRRGRAGRLAEGKVGRVDFLKHLAGDQIDVLSAGSAPADQINSIAVAAMAEEGIDITAEQPKILTPEAVQTSDVVITMGCGDACPFYPGKRRDPVPGRSPRH